MPAGCPVPGPEDPLVRGLIGVVDCHVETLARGGYASLLQPGGSLATLLTIMLTLYVAFIGFRLMLGQGQLRVGEVVMSAVKIGAVLALATQWGTYQIVVYETLFRGPEQLATAILAVLEPDRPPADVFDRLQQAFDALSGFSDAYAKHSPLQASPLLGGAGFGALSLTVAASILLLSSLGVILAAKIVLGILLALGPVFIALYLFEATRGLFEGWVRASLGFAFAPLFSTLLLGVVLAMLEPSLQQLSELNAKGQFGLSPVYAVTTLILVFAAVSAGAMIADGVIAGGLRLPLPKANPNPSASPAVVQPAVQISLQPRATRVAAAVAALERRETRLAETSGGQGGDRRMTFNTTIDRGARESTLQPERLGQGPRRSARPRPLRTRPGLAR